MECAVLSNCTRKKEKFQEEEEGSEGNANELSRQVKAYLMT